MKGISVIGKLNLNLRGSSLLTIYKYFIRPHLDYGNVIHDESNDNGLSEKNWIFSITALAITWDSRGTSIEKLYQELGLQSLKEKRWLWRVVV